MIKQPTRSDIFNMNTVYDYNIIISAETSSNRVIESRKSYIKKTNTKGKKLFVRTKNK